MALTNCSINTAQTVIQATDTNIPDQELYIVPEEGFTLSAVEFSVANVSYSSNSNNLTWTHDNNSVTLTTGITSIELSNTTTPHAVDNKIKVKVDLTNDYAMPNADTNLTIDIDGAGKLQGLDFSPLLWIGLVDDGEGYDSTSDYTITVKDEGGNTITADELGTHYPLGTFTGEVGVQTWVANVVVEVTDNGEHVLNSVYLYAPSPMWEPSMANFDLQPYETSNHSLGGGVRRIYCNLYFTPQEDYEDAIPYNSAWYNLKMSRRIAPTTTIDHVDLGGVDVGGATVDEVPSAGADVDIVVTGDVGATFEVEIEDASSAGLTTTVPAINDSGTNTTFTIANTDSHQLLDVVPDKGFVTITATIPPHTAGEIWDVKVIGTSNTSISNTTKISRSGNTITAGANGDVVNKLYQYKNPVITLQGTIVNSGGTTFSSSTQLINTSKPNRNNAELTRTYGSTLHPKTTAFTITLTKTGGKNVQSVNGDVSLEHFAFTTYNGNVVGNVTNVQLSNTSTTVTLTGNIEIEEWGYGDATLTAKLGTDGADVVTLAND